MCKHFPQPWKPAFSLDFLVRDYECDLQGRVNNAIYIHYAEHARHEFVKTYDIHLNQLNQQGYQFVVIAHDIHYRASLGSGCQFSIELMCEQLTPYRARFYQKFLLYPKQTLTTSLITTLACVNQQGQPIPFPKEALFL